MNAILSQDFRINNYTIPQIPNSAIRVKSKPQSESNSKTISLAQKSSSISDENSVLKILIKSVTITSIPININGEIVYIPLISGEDLQLLSPSLNTFVRLEPEYKNLLLNQSKIGLTLVSEFSRHPLPPIKVEFNVFLAGTNDGKYYVIYGRLNGNELFYS